MVSGSIHARLTRTSSDLRLLCAVLLPPSPILKADDSLISSISGEIPILFETTTHTCDSQFTFREPRGSRNPDEEPRTADEPDAIGVSASWMGVESDEIHVTADLPNDSHESSGGSFPDSPAGDAGHLSTPADNPLPPAGKHDDPSGIRDSRASCPTATAFSSTLVVPNEDFDGDQLPTPSTFHTLPTPTFASPSPSSSTDMFSPSSSPTGRQRHRRPLERAGAVRFPGRPWSPRLQVNEVESRPLRNASPSPTKPATRWQFTDSASGTRITDPVLPLVGHVPLPDDLSWMKHMRIELWIDQEGFRAVRLTMRLMGYSPRTRSLQPYESGRNIGFDISAGVAEFMPIKREIFTFHYATLDSPPILRTVSVVGDESRDHISRQASLSVKVNGVYTVLGTEAFVMSPNSDAPGSRIQNVRLRWKFDYLVTDRKMDGTGKALPGEKSLTPLTFSCSPYLFHPLQGKKAGLMHTMKKNLVPKLASLKLEPPPYYARSRSILPRTSGYVSTGKDVAIHARSHSDASTKRGLHPFARSRLDTGAREGTTQSVDYVQRARRRRASSAGEDGLICGGTELRHGRHAVRPKEGVFTAIPSLFQ